MAARLTPNQVLQNILDIASDESGERELEEVELEDASSEDTKEEEVDENNSRSRNQMGKDGTQWMILSRNEGRRGNR